MGKQKGYPEDVTTNDEMLIFDMSCEIKYLEIQLSTHIKENQAKSLTIVDLGMDKERLEKGIETAIEQLTYWNSKPLGKIRSDLEKLL